MVESSFIFCIMRTSSLSLWILYILPKIYQSIHHHLRRLQPIQYFIITSCLLKILSDIFLLTSILSSNQDLAIATCGLFSIQFSIQQVLFHSFTQISVFYHDYSFLPAISQVILMMLSYISITFYLISSKLTSLLFCFFVLLAYILFKIRLYQIRKYLKNLIQRLERNGLENFAVYASSYLSSVPSPDFAYFFYGFEVIFFYFNKSERFSCFILIFEFYLFLVYCKIIGNFLTSDKFFLNLIDDNLAYEEPRIKLFCVSVSRTLTAEIQDLVMIVMPGRHEIFIGEPIEEYLIYI